MNGRQKAALVTGASSGIGEAISKKLREMDYLVYGIGRHFREPSSDAGFRQINLDLLETGKLEGWVRDFKKEHTLSLLVNNAGCAYYGLHEELNPGKIREMVRLNLEVPMVLSNYFLRDLKKEKGTIVNISSVTATKASPHGCAYAATKAGLSGFSNSLFEEARKYGLRVINIQPDMTDTQLYRNANFEADAEVFAHLEAKEIAQAVAYAISLREGMCLTELTVKPQFHRISRKKD